MPRYYYDCPLKAAFMAKYHGMCFLIDGETCVRWEQQPRTDGRDDMEAVCAEWAQNNTMDETVILDCCYGMEKFYLHPDSEKMLYSMVGDVLVTNRGAHFVLATAHGGELNIDPDTKIIQRNGEAFFMPEVEQ